MLVWPVQPPARVYCDSFRETTGRYVAISCQALQCAAAAPLRSMGNPHKGTPAYKRKLKQSRDSKRARTAKRLLRRAGVKKKLLESTAWSNAEIDKWRRMSNQHMLAATGCKAQLKTTTAECASLHRKLGRANTLALRQSFELKEMQQELHDLRAEQRDNKKELSKWHLYWGWVKAHSRKSNFEWLERLWTKGPPRSKDRGWGGGQ